MKRFILLLLSITLIQFGFAQIYAPEGLNIPGQWNNWQNPPTNKLIFASQAQTDSGKVHLINTLATPIYQTIFSTGDTGEVTGGRYYQFLFTSGPSDNIWQNKWTDVAVVMDSVQLYTYHNDGGGTNDSVYLDTNKWYVINFADWGYTATKAIFMQLSSYPAFIDTLIFNASYVTSDDSVLVKMQLNHAPAPEQNFYLRYTTDSWNTWHLVQFKLTDTADFAYIPAQPTGTTVEFYAFSTVKANPSQDFDIITIQAKNNLGRNYSYTVAQSDTTCDFQYAVVTPYPPLPQEDSGVTLYFDATKGNQALEGYNGDVYLYTGVITNKSPSPTYWVHIVSKWGENLPELKFTRISSNLYKIHLTDLRKFYGITDTSEHILKLAMVIRSDQPVSTDNPDDFIVAREADGGDIFVPVYRTGQLAAKIVFPNKYKFLFASQEPVRICAYSINADSIAVFVDDSLAGGSSLDSCIVKIPGGQLHTGDHIAVVKAIRGTNAAYDTVKFLVLQPPTVAELPTGVHNGLNVINDSTVIFVLWDPPALKKFVFVIGDFNNWQPQSKFYMNRTPDGKHFWLKVTGLDSTKEYSYQYLIDGQLHLADPYAHKILDPWNDKYIPQYNYPNLKQYPYGKTYGIVSDFTIRPNQYHWQTTNFKPWALGSHQPQLIVYELLVRDFVKSSALKDVTAKLDYLKKLGINAIEIMPVNEFEGNISWGYNPDFYFAVDKYYGTNNDFKHFVDECHKRGIAVIMDITLNHSFGQCPLVRMYWNAAKEQPSADNPWYNQVSPHPMSPGYDFNHESPYTKQFVEDVLKYWLTQFHVDGFRFDLSKGFTQTHTTTLSDWAAYDQSRIDILKGYYDYIKSINPNAYVVLEHFADNDEETVLANYGFLLWQKLNEQASQALMGYADNSDFSWAYYKNRGFTYPNNLVFMESHDEERLMYKALHYGNSSSNYDVRQLDTAIDREKALATLWALIPGPKMIWQFQELGYDYSINYCQNGTVNPDCRTSPKPVRWDYVDNPKRLSLYNFYRKMFDWKQSTTFFNVANFSMNTSGIVKEEWFSSDSLNVYIIANFDVTTQNVTLHFQHTGTWYDLLTGQQLSVSSTDMNGDLNPGEFHIYADKKIQLAQDIQLGIKPTYNQTNILKIFPQPAHNTVIIESKFAGNLQFINTLGQTILQQRINYGTNTLNISELKPGIYILRLNYKHGYTQKLMLKN